MARGLKKGQCNNLAGRPKGSKNRTTELIKTHINEILLENIPEFNKRLQRLNDKDFCTIVKDVAIRFLGQSVPTTSNTQININGDDKSIKWNLVVVDASVKAENLISDTIEVDETDDEDFSDDENDSND
jgi:hypothetical protein